MISRKLNDLFFFFCAQSTLKLISSSSWAFIYFLYIVFECCLYYTKDRLNLRWPQKKLAILCQRRDRNRKNRRKPSKRYTSFIITWYRRIPIFRSNQRSHVLLVREFDTCCPRNVSWRVHTDCMACTC